MSSEKRKSLLNVSFDPLKLLPTAVGALITGATIIVVAFVGLAALMAILTVLFDLMFIYGAERARISLIDQFVPEGVYGQILNATTRTADYLHLTAGLQANNLIILLCIGAFLFIGFAMIEHRLVAIVKIQRRLLEIEEETLALRQRGSAQRRAQ